MCVALLKLNDHKVKMSTKLWTKQTLKVSNFEGATTATVYRNRCASKCVRNKNAGNVPCVTNVINPERAIQ